jgi:hypothetical protein
LVRFEFKSEIALFYFSFTVVSLENRICLSRGVQVACAAWRATTRTVAGVGDMVQRTEDGRTGQVLGGQKVGWRRAWSAPGTWRLGARVS